MIFELPDNWKVTAAKIPAAMRIFISCALSLSVFVAWYYYCYSSTVQAIGDYNHKLTQLQKLRGAHFKKGLLKQECDTLQLEHDRMIARYKTNYQECMLELCQYARKAGLTIEYCSITRDNNQNKKAIQLKAQGSTEQIQKFFKALEESLALVDCTDLHIQKIDQNQSTVEGTFCYQCIV